MWSTVCSFITKHPLHRGNRNQNGYVLYSNNALHVIKITLTSTVYTWPQFVANSVYCNKYKEPPLLIRTSTRQHNGVLWGFTLHDQWQAQKEMPLNVAKIFNIKQTNVLQTISNQLHASSNPLSSFWEDIHLRSSWFEAFIITSWEIQKGAVFNSSKERGKASQRLKIWYKLYGGASNPAVFALKNYKALFSLPSNCMKWLQTPTLFHFQNSANEYKMSL